MKTLRNETGATVLLVGIAMIVLLAICSLAIDIGHALYVRTKLQSTADAAALAAAQVIPNDAEVHELAHDFAQQNEYGDTSVLADEDIALGHWNSATHTFTADLDPLNAVRVHVRRSAVNSNPVSTWFAGIFGVETLDVEAEAVAVSGGQGGSRFLIDAEMIDSDIPVIEDLAESLGKKPEDIISDLDDDWFIDLPPGAVLELPTGQEGDPALFDFTLEEFPFQPNTDPSLEDFLNFNEDGTWREHIFPKSKLDPLVGVATVEDPDLYPSFVGGGCEVSPVYKSDGGAIEPVDGVPAVNALGMRRGLLAFKILAVGEDPDGPGGSVLPNLVIEVCAPMPINDLVIGSGSDALRLVL